jgi:tRNA/tmRNA/rRNA uracil-C5-methylase (TrmA/RlmC/RlmD family)
MDGNKLKHSFVKQSNTDINEFLQTLRGLNNTIGIQPIYDTIQPTVTEYHVEHSFTQDHLNYLNETTIKRFLINELLEKLVSENCLEFEEVRDHNSRNVKYRTKIKIQKS